MCTINRITEAREIQAEKGMGKRLLKLVMEYKLGKKRRKKRDKMCRQNKDIQVIQVYVMYKKYVTMLYYKL